MRNCTTVILYKYHPIWEMGAHTVHTPPILSPSPPILSSLEIFNSRLRTALLRRRRRRECKLALAFFSISIVSFIKCISLNSVVRSAIAQTMGRAPHKVLRWKDLEQKRVQAEEESPPDRQRDRMTKPFLIVCGATVLLVVAFLLHRRSSR
jgi:hypothetical protein